jgi:hydroxypyruvate reductase
VRQHGLDPAAFLANKDSTDFSVPWSVSCFSGPTFTNINDFRAIRIDSS